MVGSISASEVDSNAFLIGEIDKLRAALESLSTPESIHLLRGIASRVVACLRAGRKVMFCGNGGSAADAQHLAAELVGRQNYDRPAAAGLALTVDTSTLTALANDYGYESVFSRQVEALGHEGDVLIGISTSGRSANVVRALEVGRKLGITTVSFTGEKARDMVDADYVLAVPATETAKVQELQMLCGHAIFALVELTLFPPEPDAGRAPRPVSPKATSAVTR